MSIAESSKSRSGLISPEPTPGRLQLDAQGRAIPVIEAELESHLQECSAALRRMEAVPEDENPASDEEIFRAIDSHRSHRPLFEGLC